MKDLMIKKASGVLREQYQELEQKYNDLKHEMSGLKDKDSKIHAKIESTKKALQAAHEKFRDKFKLEKI